MEVTKVKLETDNATQVLYVRDIPKRLIRKIKNKAKEHRMTFKELMIKLMKEGI